MWSAPRSRCRLELHIIRHHRYQMLRSNGIRSWSLLQNFCRHWQLHHRYEIGSAQIYNSKASQKTRIHCSWRRRYRSRRRCNYQNNSIRMSRYYSRYTPRRHELKRYSAKMCNASLLGCFVSCTSRHHRWHRHPQCAGFQIPSRMSRLTHIPRHSFRHLR